MNVNPLVITTVDRQDVPEVYVNTVRSIGVVEGAMHFDLSVTRVDVPDSGKPPTSGNPPTSAKSVLALRIVMPLSCAAAVQAGINVNLAEVQKQQGGLTGAAPARSPAKH